MSSMMMVAASSLSSGSIVLFLPSSYTGARVKAKTVARRILRLVEKSE